MALKIVSGLDVTSISLSSYLDLAKNELRNAQIHNLTTTQINGIASPVAGQFVFDTTLNKLKVYNATEDGAWELVGAEPDNTTIELSSNTLSVKNSGITAAKLASSAVTTAKIAADAVTGAKIADDTIDSEHYVAGSIDSEHLATDSVTAAKIADNSVDIARLNVTDGTNGQFLKTDGAGNLSFAVPADEDVSIENLASKLALLTENYTLGDASDVTATFAGGVTITGNLTVNGTTTTVNSTTTTLDDPIITLGGDTAPSSDDNKDRGVEFRYYDTAARLGFFGYDDSDRVFTCYTNAGNESEVFSGTYAAAKFGSMTLSDGLNAASVVITGTGFSLNGTALTSTIAELNKLDGFTGGVADLNYAKDLRATGVTAAEFDKLDGLTATTTELNYVDGVTSNVQTQLNGKPDYYSASVTVSGGSATVAFSSHGIGWPAVVQLYTSDGNLVLADIAQTTEGDNDITITATNGNYVVVVMGAA